MAGRNAAVVQFNHLPQLKGELRATASRIVRKTCFDVLAASQAVVPVDTGNLKNSGAVEMENDLQGVIYYAADYAIYVELGTRFMRAQPYLTPSAEAARGPFHAAMHHLIKGA